MAQISDELVLLALWYMYENVNVETRVGDILKGVNVVGFYL